MTVEPGQHWRQGDRLLKVLHVGKDRAVLRRVGPHDSRKSLSRIAFTTLLNPQYQYELISSPEGDQ